MKSRNRRKNPETMSSTTPPRGQYAPHTPLSKPANNKTPTSKTPASTTKHRHHHRLNLGHAASSYYFRNQPKTPVQKQVDAAVRKSRRLAAAAAPNPSTFLGDEETEEDTVGGIFNHFNNIAATAAAATSKNHQIGSLTYPNSNADKSFLSSDGSSTNDDDPFNNTNSTGGDGDMLNKTTNSDTTDYTASNFVRNSMAKQQFGRQSALHRRTDKENRQQPYNNKDHSPPPPVASLKSPPPPTVENDNVSPIEAGEGMKALDLQQKPASKRPLDLGDASPGAKEAGNQTSNKRRQTIANDLPESYEDLLAQQEAQTTRALPPVDRRQTIGPAAATIPRLSSPPKGALVGKRIDATATTPLRVSKRSPAYRNRKSIGKWSQNVRQRLSIGSAGESQIQPQKRKSIAPVAAVNSSLRASRRFSKRFLRPTSTAASAALGVEDATTTSSWSGRSCQRWLAENLTIEGDGKRKQRRESDSCSYMSSPICQEDIDALFEDVLPAINASKQGVEVKVDRRRDSMISALSEDDMGWARSKRGADEDVSGRDTMEMLGISRNKGATLSSDTVAEMALMEARIAPATHSLDADKETDASREARRTTSKLLGLKDADVVGSSTARAAANEQQVPASRDKVSIHEPSSKRSNTMEMLGIRDDTIGREDAATLSSGTAAEMALMEARIAASGSFDTNQKADAPEGSNAAQSVPDEHQVPTGRDKAGIHDPSMKRRNTLELLGIQDISIDREDGTAFSSDTAAEMALMEARIAANESVDANNEGDAPEVTRRTTAKLQGVKASVDGSSAAQNPADENQLSQGRDTDLVNEPPRTRRNSLELFGSIQDESIDRDDGTACSSDTAAEMALMEARIAAKESLDANNETKVTRRTTSELHGLKEKGVFEPSFGARDKLLIPEPSNNMHNPMGLPGISGEAEDGSLLASAAGDTEHLLGPKAGIGVGSDIPRLRSHGEQHEFGGHESIGGLVSPRNASKANDGSYTNLSACADDSVLSESSSPHSSEFANKAEIDDLFSDLSPRYRANGASSGSIESRNSSFATSDSTSFISGQGGREPESPRNDTKYALAASSPTKQRGLGAAQLASGGDARSQSGGEVGRSAASPGSQAVTHGLGAAEERPTATSDDRLHATKVDSESQAVAGDNTSVSARLQKQPGKQLTSSMRKRGAGLRSNKSVGFKSPRELQFNPNSPSASLTPAAKWQSLAPSPLTERLQESGKEGREAGRKPTASDGSSPESMDVSNEGDTADIGDAAKDVYRLGMDHDQDTTEDWENSSKKLFNSDESPGPLAAAPEDHPFSPVSARDDGLPMQEEENEPTMELETQVSALWTAKDDPKLQAFIDISSERKERDFAADDKGPTMELEDDFDKVLADGGESATSPTQQVSANHDETVELEPNIEDMVDISDHQAENQANVILEDPHLEASQSRSASGQEETLQLEGSLGAFFKNAHSDEGGATDKQLMDSLLGPSRIDSKVQEQSGHSEGGESARYEETSSIDEHGGSEPLDLSLEEVVGLASFRTAPESRLPCFELLGKADQQVKSLGLMHLNRGWRDALRHTCVFLHEQTMDPISNFFDSVDIDEHNLLQLQQAIRSGSDSAVILREIHDLAEVASSNKDIELSNWLVKVAEGLLTSPLAATCDEMAGVLTRVEGRSQLLRRVRQELRRFKRRARREVKLSKLRLVIAGNKATVEQNEAAALANGGHIAALAELKIVSEQRVGITDQLGKLRFMASSALKDYQFVVGLHKAKPRSITQTLISFYVVGPCPSACVSLSFDLSNGRHRFPCEARIDTSVFAEHKGRHMRFVAQFFRSRLEVLCLALSNDPVEDPTYLGPRVQQLEARYERILLLAGELEKLMFRYNAKLDCEGHDVSLRVEFQKRKGGGSVEILFSLPSDYPLSPVRHEVKSGASSSTLEKLTENLRRLFERDRRGHHHLSRLLDITRAYIGSSYFDDL